MMYQRRRFVSAVAYGLRVPAGLLLLVFSIAACQPGIQVMEPGDALSPLPVSTVTPAEHDMALVGVDFDPPLTDGLFLSDGITLLVAIENRGLSDESTVHVTASLLDWAAGNPQGEYLLHETVLVRELAPGEVRVVRFAEVTNLPDRSRYHLVVEIAPLADEGDVTDNVRTYDVSVGGAD